MAVISRTGISNGSTLDASHITNIIDALDGTSTTTHIIASGSFTGSFGGSFNGTATSASSAIAAVTAATASNITVTNTATGTGPYYVVFADGTTGHRAARVDSGSLTFNATTNTLTVTSSNAILATTATAAPLIMQFTHTTTSSLQATPWFFANFAANTFTSANRMYCTSPITGTIISASVDTHNAAGYTGSAKISFQVVLHASASNAISSSLAGSVFTQPGSGFISSTRAALDTPLDVLAGNTLSIKYISDTTTTNNLAITNAVTLYFRP